MTVGDFIDDECDDDELDFDDDGELDLDDDDELDLDDDVELDLLAVLGDELAACGVSTVAPFN
ncbi:MAG TPA: hypothetical protein VJ824_08690 [Bacillota bacterium]|nr:hypothetical protein [Bacillota bacterium]